MAAMASLRGIVPCFERGASHYGGCILHHVHRPVLLRVYGVLMLDGGILCPGAELGQDGTARERSGGAVRSVPEAPGEHRGLVGAELGMP